MAAFAHSERRKIVQMAQIVGCLALLVLGGVLIFSGCGPGPLEEETTINELNGIISLSASNAWAVGWAEGRGSSPLIEHWNGRTWSLVPAPGKGDQSILESVAARSAQDVWAVGLYSKGVDEETLIEHWNGTAWSIVASPNGSGDNRLLGVAAVSATDVWAVGVTVPCRMPPGLTLREPGNALVRGRLAGRSATCTDPSRPLIEHWDGQSWSIIASPNPDPKATLAVLGSVVAFGRDDVWASGTYFGRDVTPPDGAALVEHWDGTAWHIRSDFDTAIGGRMWATAFLSSSDIWGAEYATSHGGKPVIKHWNGGTWRVVTAPFEESSGYALETMAASAPDDLWAAGNYATAQQSDGQGQVFIMHWNGSAWSLVPSPSPAGGTIMLTASASRSSDDAWMVGTYYPSRDTQLTFIEHWDGHAWRLVPNPNPAEPAPAGP